MLTEKQKEVLRDEAFYCKNPVYFFDNDADGLSAFLLLHDIIKEGKGYSARTGPELTAEFSSRVKSDNDKVFVIDKAMISEAFLYNVKKKIVWIDHHMPQIITAKNIVYINPRQNDFESYFSATSCIYEVFKNDLSRKWVAAVGMLGDWCIPDFTEELKKQYPKFIASGSTAPEVSNADIRLMIRVFHFIQKGDSHSIRKAIEALMLVKEPYEILEQSSENGAIVWKKFEAINEEYKKVMETAQIKDYGNVVVCTFQPLRCSFTKEIAQELVLEHPDKILLVLREREGTFMGSIRGKDSLSKGEKAMSGLKGSLGGHEDAAGMNIDANDFDEFVKRLNNA